MTSTPPVTEQLPDAARLVRWWGDRIVIACADGSLMVRASSRPPQVLFCGNAAPLSLAVGEGGFVCGFTDGTVVAGTGTELDTTTVSGPVLAATACGPRLVVAAGEEVHLVGPLHTGTVNPAVGRITAIERAAGSCVVVGGARGLAWFDPGFPAIDDRLVAPGLVTLAPHPHHSWVAAGTLGGSIHLVRPGVHDGIELAGYPDRVALLAWTSDGAGLCAAADDELTLWRWGTPHESHTDEAPASFIAHDEPITALAASPHDGIVATGDAAGVVQLWKPVQSDAPVATVRVDGVVLGLAWHASGRVLAITTSAGQLISQAVRPAAAP